MKYLPSLLTKFHDNSKMPVEVRVNLNQKFLYGWILLLDNSKSKGIDSTRPMKRFNNKFVFIQRMQSILFQEIRFPSTKLTALLFNKKSLLETIKFWV